MGCRSDSARDANRDGPRQVHRPDFVVAKRRQLLPVGRELDAKLAGGGADRLEHASVTADPGELSDAVGRAEPGNHAGRRRGASHNDRAFPKCGSHRYQRARPVSCPPGSARRCASSGMRPPVPTGTNTRKPLTYSAAPASERTRSARSRIIDGDQASAALFRRAVDGKIQELTRLAAVAETGAPSRRSASWSTAPADRRRR